MVILEDGSQLVGEELLVATGRAPVTADLGLAAAGMEVTDRGFIRVDDHLRNSAEAHRHWSRKPDLIVDGPPTLPDFSKRLLG